MFQLIFLKRNSRTVMKLWAINQIMSTHLTGEAEMFRFMFGNNIINGYLIEFLFNKHKAYNRRGHILINIVLELGHLANELVVIEHKHLRLLGQLHSQILLQGVRPQHQLIKPKPYTLNILNILLADKLFRITHIEPAIKNDTASHMILKAILHITFNRVRCR